MQHLKNKKILIMGAGNRGKQLLRYFRTKGIDVYGFLDNNNEKHGTKIEGITCYPVGEGKNDNDVVVYISPMKADNLYKEISRIYKNVIAGDEVDEICQTAVSAGYKDCDIMYGHYYHLYPMLEDVEKRQKQLYDIHKPILGVELQEDHQLNMLNKMKPMFDNIPVWAYLGEHSKYRYKLRNNTFEAGDAVCLWSILQVIRPKRIIEVGSGWTSSIMLDLNEFQMNYHMELSFIEPYPERLLSTLKPEDRVDLQTARLEEIDLAYFGKLEAGDILFIDSTHVSKPGSDVNYLFFEILPRLKKGVYVHFHDIFYPFEYPMEWIRKGRVWNEIYLLRSFLQYNNMYKIEFF